ncbi:MAG: helix-turn-helix domain-containing protein, partial [Bacteroides sp.]
MAHLTLEQRYTIQVLREEKLSQQAIAKRIGKDKSLVSREIRRNADKRNGTYKAELAGVVSLCTFENRRETRG